MKIVTCILLAVSLLCIVTAAVIRSDTSERGVFSNDIEEALKNGPYTEPENANVPEGLEWNPDLGEYYMPMTTSGIRKRDFIKTSPRLPTIHKYHFTAQIRSQT